MTRTKKSADRGRKNEEAAQRFRLEAGIDPSEQEISRICQEIRNSWSNRERVKRSSWAVSAPVELTELTHPRASLGEFIFPKGT